ncbi:MAG: hypothetical protein KDH95_04205 [Calditrichaeota bacterium]|nr:hypothetical protein [Calditrichota bacterium]MCB0267350.1 hypothetical protein [Calditrichota bacterium]
MSKKLFFRALVLIAVFLGSVTFGQAQSIAKISVTETAGFSRDREYVEISLQIPLSAAPEDALSLSAVDGSGVETSVQILRTERISGQNVLALWLVFPVAVNGMETKHYELKFSTANAAATDLQFAGEGTELVVENQFYRADMTRSDNSSEQKELSGQIREITMKRNGQELLMTNIENRVHWAPNFKRPEVEWYTTIAHWQNPRTQIDRGNYVIRTIRQDPAPKHPEIFLTAVYKYYANVPYFRFYSEMDFTEDLGVELLRNDEMTTDSMFTHLAFEDTDGKITVEPLYPKTGKKFKGPIDNEAPWLCFYHETEGFALGSIRLMYDNTNDIGEPSPTWQPHTQIGEWEGKRYWNRRLVHDRWTFIPKGSRYAEENAYLLFEIGENDPFETIRYWAERLRHPVTVKVE